MVQKKALTYAQSGVDYSLLDQLKRMAQVAGKATASGLMPGYTVDESARGESASYIEAPDGYYSFVQEGLGTKNLVADEVASITGKSHYDAIAQDTVAMIVNDLITIGATPLMVAAYWAIGDVRWLENRARMEDLTSGWAQACRLAGAFWGGGETPILSGIIHENTIDLAGSAFGVVRPKSRLVTGDKLRAGDAIVVFESSGIHANGLTLARKIAENLPEGYATKMPSGQMYGEALLTPTHIYAKLVIDILESGVDIHYMANITGHGWRKLMRASTPFTYRVTNLPEVPEVFSFIQKHGPVSEEEMYGNFNMGAGFAIFVDKKDVGTIFTSSEKYGIKAMQVGVVEEGKKQVIIEPISVTFAADELQLRG